MSIQITTSFVEQYSSNVSMLSQQRGRKQRGTEDEEKKKGKNAINEQVGVTAEKKRTSREGDTLQNDTNDSRRRMSGAENEGAEREEEVDKVRRQVDQISPHVKAVVVAKNRARDEVNITVTNVWVKTGVAGGTFIVKPKSQKTVIREQKEGRTIAKHRAGKKIKENNEVEPPKKRYRGGGPQQITEI
jgi:hypothetical protein